MMARNGGLYQRLIEMQQHDLTTQASIKPGDYFSTSWGYDQTNYDYLVVVKVSSTGKTATCKMVSPIYLGASGVHDVITPGTAYGEPFTMQVRRWEDVISLRGSYPYCLSSKRLDTFHLVKLGDTHYQTNTQFGH